MINNNKELQGGMHLIDRLNGLDVHQNQLVYMDAVKGMQLAYTAIDAPKT